MEPLEPCDAFCGGRTNAVHSTIRQNEKVGEQIKYVNVTSLTNELDDGDYIMEFVSGGPKNYGYTTKSRNVCYKVRGFTLNFGGSAQLNQQVMRQNVLDKIQHPLEEHRDVEVIKIHLPQP